MYVDVTASPSATSRTPAELVALRLIEPVNWAEAESVSVNVTVSPASSESESIVTSTVSMRLSSRFRPQSATVIVAMLSHAYLVLSSWIVTTSEHALGSRRLGSPIRLYISKYRRVMPVGP